MFSIRNSKDSSKLVLIAETEDDMKCLRLFFDSHIVFGLWKLYEAKEDKTKISGDYKFLQKVMPLAYGFAMVNEVKDYVPKEK